MKEYKYKHLIFCGGGIKLYTFIGAIKVLEEKKILNNVETFVGTSIGGLVAALLNIKYTHDELYKLIGLLKLNEFINIDIGNLYNNNYGLDDGAQIESLIRTLFKAKLGKDRITFKELYNLSEKHLIITATCLSTRKIEYFDYIKYPDLDVIDGIRMAITIPLFFTYQTYKNKIFVDGGVLDQYPVHVLKDKPIEEILGLRLGEINRNISFNIDSIQSYFMNIIRCMMEEIELLRLDNKYNKNTIYYENTLSSVDMDIDLEKKLELYNDGIKKTDDFFNNNDENDESEENKKEKEIKNCDKETQIYLN